MKYGEEFKRLTGFIAQCQQNTDKTLFGDGYVVMSQREYNKILKYKTMIENDGKRIKKIRVH